MIEKLKGLILKMDPIKKELVQKIKTTPESPFFKVDLTGERI